MNINAIKFNPQKALFIEKLSGLTNNDVILKMSFSFSLLSYKQKSLVAEVVFLFVIGVVSPFAVGLQTWSWISFTFSYVFLTVLGLPVIMLFYRVYLPYTVGKNRYALAGVLFPVYILLYELSTRLAFVVVIAMPFVPLGYRNGLAYAKPLNFTRVFFNEDFGYTIMVLLSVTSLYVLKLLFKNRHNLFVLENEKLKMELNHLKAQVQPHFFFNTLNNMYALSVVGSPKTPAMIADLSGIMRYVLYNAEQDKVPLRQEVDFIRSYIELENLRHSGKESIEFSVQGNISNVFIEPLIFLPLIENTFKHSLQKDLLDKWVKLILTVDEEELIFQTSNPKNAGDAVADPGGGIGLKNVKKRLELLYPGRHQLNIYEEGNIFTVTLAIKFKQA
jgi:two-component system LytT family sensor kinase